MYKQYNLSWKDLQNRDANRISKEQEHRYLVSGIIMALAIIVACIM